MGVTRERVGENIELTRPTRITKYLTERRWCPRCRTYHEDALTDVLPRQNALRVSIRFSRNAFRTIWLHHYHDFRNMSEIQ